MNRKRRVPLGRIFSAALALIIAGGLVRAFAPPAVASPSEREVVLIFGPGGVLTRDGGMWQYRIDQEDWVTIDQAFLDQGQTTHVLPLPVPVLEIEDMESFGFLVTKAGVCWLYDLETDAWINTGSPSGR